MPYLLRHIRGCRRKPPSQPIDYAHIDPIFTCGRRGYVVFSDCCCWNWSTAYCGIWRINSLWPNDPIWCYWPSLFDNARTSHCLNHYGPIAILTFRSVLQIAYKICCNEMHFETVCTKPHPFVQSPKFKPDTDAITGESLMNEFRLDGCLSDFGSRHPATIVW